VSATKVNSKLNTKIYIKALIILCFIYLFSWWDSKSHFKSSIFNSTIWL